jgi:hypothetical protein
VTRREGHDERRHTGDRRPPSTAWVANGLAALLVLASCARPPLLARAVAARGGPLHGVARWIDADVRVGVPGQWEWRKVFLAPDHFALSIVTTGEQDHYLFDGTIASSFIGDREVATEGASTALASQARFEQVIWLDVLGNPAVQIASLAPAELPADVASGISVQLPESAARYRLGFDDRTRLVWAAGPLDFSPFGSGEIDIRFSDFRDVDGMQLPFRSTYTTGGKVFLEERVRHICPNPPGLTPAAFRTPQLLPVCSGS